MLNSFVHIFRNGSDVTLCLLHGTGGDEYAMLPIAGAIDPHAAVISIRGTVNENGMNRFFRRHAEGVFDQEDIILQSGNIMAFLQAAAKHYIFDLRKTIFLGYSNGANIATSMLFLHPKIVQYAILLRPMVPLVPDIHPDLRDHSVLISAGTDDSLTTSKNTEHLRDLFKKYGANTELAWLDTGHGLIHEDIKKAQEWYRRLYERLV